jgi:hypothetical protein
LSTIKATTLSNLAGSKTVPTDTVVDGSAKAWVNFNGTGTVAIRRAFNVSSITDNGTGDYTVNFTSAMSDANYAYTTTIAGSSGTGQTSGQVNATVPTTTPLRVFSATNDVGAADVPGYSVSIFS